MDFGYTLTKAWHLTWRNKYLLVLGFLAGLGSTTSSSINFSFDSSDAPLVTEARVERFLTQYWFVLVGLGGAVILLAVVLWLIRLAAQGGLISAVSHIEAGERVGLGQAISIGMRYLMRMIGLNLLLYAPFIVLGFLLLAASLVVGAGALGMIFTDGEFFRVLLTSSAILTACLAIILCILLPLLIVITAFYPFAQRALVLHDLGVFDSVRDAWQTMRLNIGEVILLVIILVILSVAYGFAVALLTLPFTFLAFFPALANVVVTGTFGPGDFMLMACGGVLISIVAAILSSLLITYRSAVVTLAYQQFKTKKGSEISIA